jgi:hypothetical protein
VPAQPTARWPQALFWVIVLALLPVMVSLSKDFGATYDEFDRHKGGLALVEFFDGKASREEAHYGTMYPGLFDVIPAWLERHIQTDRYVLRHQVNAVFGWVGILFAGLLAGRLFGIPAGILAVMLLAASPRYFAHSMNNPKDLPFAATSVMVLYCLSRVSPRRPYITIGSCVALAVALGLCLGTRPGALLYFGYVPLLVVGLFAVQWGGALRRAGWRAVRHWRRLPALARVHWTTGLLLGVKVSLVLCGGLLVGTIFWPWAQVAPFTRPVEALTRAAGYDWEGQVLFDGRYLYANDLPWSYLPTWFLIGTPLVVLAGMALSMIADVRGWGWSRLALWTVALLPIVLIIARDSMVYDGMRHVLFAYPPMAVLAASGWAGLLTYRQRWVRVGGMALLLVGMLPVLAFHLRSHPNQTAYVNELAGGPRAVFGRYDLDYWGNCLLQAVEWSAATARRAEMPVQVWARPAHLARLDAARFRGVSVISDGDEPHHLRIDLLRGSPNDVRLLASRPDAVHRVTTGDGAVLCVVSRGPQYGDLQQRLNGAGKPGS